MNYQEILDILKEKIKEVDQFAHEDYDNEELGLGEIEEIAQQGGEGEGSTWYSVKYFKDHNIYIRVDGYYQSYNGTEFYDGWNCCSECKPVERLVTFYE